MMMGKRSSFGSKIRYGTIFTATKCRQQQRMNISELEGVALFDYMARSVAELSFKQGGRLRLYSRASSDWWKGEIDGSVGLIPDKYISVPSGCQAEEQPAQTRVRLSSDKSGLSSSQALAGKISLQIPTAPASSISPRVLRKPEAQMRKNTADNGREEAKIQVDKEVHQHMNVVFKELLVRQQQQDQGSSTSVPPSTLSSSSGSPQPINKKGTTSQKAKGIFKSTEQMN